ncbi:MAG: helix-turn-helix transcriptional regulator [Oscillospiraceae bacterium]|nr:helix-turn-helix transcriptional regulator [Oscillospiraceae bacterium]
MIDYKTVGHRIRTVRLQKKLAEAAGVGVTHISHIETGNSIPSLQITVDIVNALGCSMDELLCVEAAQARSVRDSWLGELVADCSDEEVKLVTDTVLALKASLRRLNITER